MISKFHFSENNYSINWTGQKEESLFPNIQERNFNIIGSSLLKESICENMNISQGVCKLHWRSISYSNIIPKGNGKNPILITSFEDEVARPMTFFVQVSAYHNRLITMQLISAQVNRKNNGVPGRLGIRPGSRT